MRYGSYAVAACVITFFLGLFGNGIIAFTFLRNRNMRNVPNTYILSQAFVNLLYVIVCLPIYPVHISKFGALATFFCKLASATDMIFDVVSAFTLIALTRERYYDTVRPIGIFQMRSQAVRTIISIWVVACILALHPGIFNYVKYVNPDMAYCYVGPDVPEPFRETYWKVHTLIVVLICYILPLFIITTYFILMAQRRSAGQRIPHVRQLLTGVLLVCAIVFFIGITPDFTSTLVIRFTKQTYFKYYKIWTIVNTAGFLFRIFIPSAMPIIMYTMGGCNLRYLHSLPPPRPDPAPDTEMAVAPLCEDVCTEHGNVIVVL